MPSLYRILNVAIALVWLGNGLFCKVLNMVPRHRQIVARILGDGFAPLFTPLIGLAEIVMFVWVISRYRSKLCAVMQITVVAVMNVIEYFLAPDLLLFGRLNSVFALLFIVVVFVTEFVLNKQTADVHA